MTSGPGVQGQVGDGVKRERDLDERGACDCALGLLARREHSRHELVQKLRQRGFDEAAIAPALDRLVADGYQSDRRFAEALLRSRLERGYGPFRMRMELRRHGVDEGVWAPALAQLDQTVDWQEQARLAVRGRHPGPSSDTGAWAKRVRFLERRGFPLDIARAAARIPTDGET